MKLIEKIKSAIPTHGDAPKPPRATFATRPDIIYAPVTGLLVSIEEINDEVISAKLMGDGYGILPVGDCVYAPADGRVVMTTVTNHAIGILTGTGAQVILHVGLGTVEMNGKGFTRFVEQGDEVKAGDPLIAFDSAAIKEAGYEDVVTCVVANLEQVGGIDHVANSNTLIGNRPLVKIGDPLLLTRRRI